MIDKIQKYMINDEIKGRFFLVGCPRSGTTLLQSLLAAHPQIASFPESHFFPYAVGGRWRRLLGISSPKVKERLYQFLRDIDHIELKNLIPKYGFLLRCYVKAFVRILDGLTIKQGKDIWVEKTPRHLHYIYIIEKYMPDAKFIHIIRNGKDVVASLYDVTHKYPEVWGKPRGIEQCINRWNSDLRITQQYIHKDNHMVTKFERLTENPETVLKNVCEFIRVEFTQVMEDQHGLLAERLTLKNEAWKSSTKEKIINNNNRKFDNLFSKEEKNYIKERLENLSFDT